MNNEKTNSLLRRIIVRQFDCPVCKNKQSFYLDCEQMKIVFSKLIVCYCCSSCGQQEEVSLGDICKLAKLLKRLQSQEEVENV